MLNAYDQQQWWVRCGSKGVCKFDGVAAERDAIQMIREVPTQTPALAASPPEASGATVCRRATCSPKWSDAFRGSLSRWLEC